MKHQNLVFLPASDALRQDLFTLGLDFLLVKIEGKSHFMVVTNQLKLSFQLAVKHAIVSFYLSDSRRQIFRATHGYFGDFPEKLGRLTKDPQKTGKPFLVVTEDNSTYHYIVK